jgi:hypothetical protein
MDWNILHWETSETANMTFIYSFQRSRDSSLGRAMGYELNARVRFPSGGMFSLHHSVQTASGTHPAVYTMGTGGYFPGK